MASSGVSNVIFCTEITFLGFNILPFWLFANYCGGLWWMWRFIVDVEVHGGCEVCDGWWIIISLWPHFESEVLQGWSPQVILASTPHLASLRLAHPVLAPYFLVWPSERFLGEVVFCGHMNKYYGLTVCVPPPPHSYVEALIPSVMMLGGRASGRPLGLEEFMRVGSSRWD